MQSISSRLGLVAALLSLSMLLWSGVGVAEAHHRRSEKPRHHVRHHARAHKSDVEEDIVEVEVIEQYVGDATPTELVEAEAELREHGEWVESLL